MYLQNLSALLYGNNASISPPILRIEYSASGPLVAVLPEVPENPHANNRFTLQISDALNALGIRKVQIRVEKSLDFTVKPAAFFPDVDYRSHLPSPIVNCPPLPDRRRQIGGWRCRGHARRRPEEHNRGNKQIKHQTVDEAKSHCPSISFLSCV